MKTILTIILLMFFVSCEMPVVKNDKQSPPSANQGNGETEEETPVLEEPVEEEEEEELEEEEEEEEEEVDSNPYFYNHTLYVKSFSYKGYNFKSRDLIDKDNYTVFESSNTQSQAVGINVLNVYARILFKDGEKVKIQHYYDITYNNKAGTAYFRDWVMYDDMEFHIDGYRVGSFGWHSRIIPTLKTQNEIDDGVEKYSHTENHRITHCYATPNGPECRVTVRVTDIYNRYYFE